MNVVQEVTYLIALWANRDLVHCVLGEASAICFNCSVHQSASRTLSSAVVFFVLL